MISARPQAAPRALLGIFIGALVLLGSVLLAPGAHADPDDDVVRDLTISYELDASGDLHVTETYQWDFGDREGLGFYRVLIHRMGYEPDPSKARVLEYSNFEVTSPSGAPAQVWVDQDNGTQLRLSIGAPDGSSDTRTGVQSYVLSYDVSGAVNAIRDQAGVPDADELYYNVFSDSPNRVENVSITVSGPAGVTDVACYAGREGTRDACDSYESQGATATFGAQDLARRDGLTIMAAFPTGTFTDPGPILVDLPAGSGAAGFVRNNWPVVAGVGALLLAGLGLGRVRAGRDRAYAGLPVGSLPEAGVEYAEQRLTLEPPITARLFPPEGLRPAEAMVIADKVATVKAFTATMIDLAVRGYYTIEPLPDGDDEVTNWRLVRKPNPRTEDLRPFEQQLLTAFFSGRDSVTTKKLRKTAATTQLEFVKALNEHADRNGWFVKPGQVKPRTSATRLIFIAIAFTVVVAAAILLGVVGLGGHLTPILAAVGLLAVGAVLVYLLTSRAARARSALGRAHYEQIRGFREHLSSVEGHQLRWETGDDIFSDYLPWAVGFDLTKRWVGIFDKLAEEGRYVMVPAWYLGSRTHFADEMNSVATTMSSSMTYTPGASGTSGSFSSGGGFSGGGVGGGSFGGR